VSDRSAAEEILKKHQRCHGATARHTRVGTSGGPGSRLVHGFENIRQAYIIVRQKLDLPSHGPCIDIADFVDSSAPRTQRTRLSRPA